VSIICDSNPSQDSYQDRPVVLIEVLSSDTRRSDETEKKDAYLSIPSLKGYLLVEQQSSKVSVYRRQNEGFVGEVYQGTEAIVQVPGFDITLPLSEVYTGIQFDSDPSHSQMP
jgi:Uma2 family endonuclease